MKKFKSKDFARGVDRERIREVEMLGIKLEEFLELALNALKSIADKLGL
jgi:predicted hydrolase (HD superfamily)